MGARLTIALDAMGGDNGPETVLAGAARAALRFPDAHFLVFGDEAVVRPVMDRHPGLGAACEVRHTDLKITADIKPSAALRSGRGSSMWLAIDAVERGEAAGVVSAGNTGALMAIAMFVLKMPPGIDRPAIATTFPTLRGESVMLDLGANVDCDAENLVQFAIIGAIFARSVLGLSRPTVGLLNVGAEEMKGREPVRDASAILRSRDVAFDFAGFVEGNDIPGGRVDVVVTDGFSGNIALKTAEGTAKLYSEYLKKAFKSSLLAQIGYLFARPALEKLRGRVDPRRYNGAILLGLNGIVVKSHGSADAFGFANAVAVAIDMVQHRFMEGIREEIARYTQAMMPQAAAVE